MNFPVDEIWIEEEAREEPVTLEILRRLPRARILIGREMKEAKALLDLDPDPIAGGKKILRLLKHKGAFLKPCPGTSQYICCGLQILSTGQGCPMDCRYCALQAYFNRPTLEIFVNMDDLLDELHGHLQADTGRFHRICTGEFTDSMALDHLVGMVPRLVEFFSSAHNASLEIKTKTDFVEPLLDLDPRGRVILSFSVNSARIVRTEEKRASPLARRLTAAVRGQLCGYRLAFHFDPVIPYQGWEADYEETVDSIFRQVDPHSVAWISIGVLRFVPKLKEAALFRFGPVSYLHDEFLQGFDGKFRLPAERRIAVYRYLSERIITRCPDARIYLCMESPYVWKEALGMEMNTDADLSRYLDEAVCG